MIVLGTHRLTGGYGKGFVVDAVDVQVRAGRCLAVLGPNGAGKSTLLRMLAGILPAQSGEIELLGRPLQRWRRREVAQRIGYVPQTVDFTFPLTVREVVEQGRAPHLGPWHPPSPHDRTAVHQALTRMGLEGKEKTPVQRLSGGERQRVLLARALAGEPRVLLFDEPATALDVRHQLELVSVARGLLAEGVALVLVVHDWNLALKLADEIVVLRNGRTVAAGTPTRVLGPDLLRVVFGVEVEVLVGADGSPHIAPQALAPETTE